MFKKIMIIAAVLTIVSAATAYAGVWEQDAGSWYYINEDGSKATGRISDNGKDYYLAEDGRMLTEGVHLLPNDQIIICNADGSIFYSNSFHRNGLDDRMLAEAYSQTYENWGILSNSFVNLNEYRAAAGSAPITDMSFELSVLATYRCIDMVENNYFTHRKDGIALYGKVYEAFYGQKRTTAENMISLRSSGKVRKTTEQFVTGANASYEKSPGHYKIMIGDFNKVGIGVYSNAQESARITVQIYER